MGKSIVIKGGKLLDPKNQYRLDIKDIFIENGKIVAIKDEIEVTEGMEVLPLKGEIVTPGWIDIHTHVYQAVSLGIQADTIGVQTGVTTVFDAGSSGAQNFVDFKEKTIDQSKTKVYALLNAASRGLEKERYELADLAGIDPEAVAKVVGEYPQEIVGIKARASASTVGELGIQPIAKAKEIAKGLGLPLVVHIGNCPPTIEEVLALMEKGDVITHCFHGKANGLLGEDGNIRPEAWEAKERGVCFDIGHGTSSFNFKVAAQALEQNFIPDIISTDIYLQNYQGPVYSLAMTINKMLALGMSLDNCIAKVTTVPAQIFNLENRGMLKEGAVGDLTIFKLIQEDVSLKDSDGNLLDGKELLQVTHCVKDGEVILVKGER